MKLRWSRWRAKISNKNRNANYAADPSVVTGREDTCIWNLATIIFSLSPMLVLICTIAFIQVSHCEEGQILQQLTPASSTCAWTSYEHTSLIHVIISYDVCLLILFYICIHPGFTTMEEKHTPQHETLNFWSACSSPIASTSSVVITPILRSSISITSRGFKHISRKRPERTYLSSIQRHLWCSSPGSC